MKFTKFTKYTGEPADSVDLEELVKRLGDFFLQSGFESQYYGISEFDPDRSMEALREAILRALQEGDLLPNDKMTEELRKLLNHSDASNNQEIKDLLDKLVERLSNEGFINPQQQPQITPPNQASARGAIGDPQERKTEARFEITDKTIDFLGFKTLRDLLGSLGRSSFGRHDTRDLATGVETSGASRAYEFGDTLNLDVSETLFNAVRRDGAKVPIEIGYKDLMVHQCEYQSSCATVVMLDCSHSMILYGEDRFTPAKKVALALSHLLRTQYPGDSLHLVLFHDSAEEVPLSQLAKVRVGPYYTNTREGLRLALLLSAGLAAHQRERVRVGYTRFDLPNFDAYVYVTMADAPAFFTAAPWGYRVLAPRIVHLFPPRARLSAFRGLAFTCIVGSGGLLFLFLRRLGHREAVALVGVALFVLSRPVRLALSMPMLGEPLAVLLEIAA